MSASTSCGHAAELALVHRAITGCEQMQQTTSLFDHLVGGREQFVRHVLLWAKKIASSKTSTASTGLLTIAEKALGA
jgi:hypothetical protein